MITPNQSIWTVLGLHGSKQLRFPPSVSTKNFPHTPVTQFIGREGRVDGLDAVVVGVREAVGPADRLGG